MTYHCAHRNKDKPSKISARMAARKNCRHKWRNKPCRFSYVLGDEVDEYTQVNIYKEYTDKGE